MNSPIQFEEQPEVEEEVYSPTFKQPFPTSEYNSQTNPRNSTKVDMLLSASAIKDFWESDITSNIFSKNQSMVVVQGRTGVPEDLQLYRNISKKTNGRQFEFENIPPPDPFCSHSSRIVKEIYNKPGNASVEQHYQAAKLRQSHKTTLEPPSKDSSKTSLIINPKDAYKSFDNYSKSQKHYSKVYAQSLEKECFERGLNKPFESPYCVNNYMYNQICPSGLATHKFISVKAKKRLSLMNTQTMESKIYPFSPRTVVELQDINRKKNDSRLRIDKFKSRKDKVFDEYKEVLLSDATTVTKDFLKQYKQFKDKKSKVFGSRMQEIDDVVDYMKRQKADTQTAFDIVMDIHNRKKPPIVASRLEKKGYTRKRASASATVMSKV